MYNFEDEVQYFNELVFKNIQKAKERKKRKDEMVFFNLDIRKDGQEIAIFNQEKDYVYTLFTKDIEEFNFKQYLIKELALRYIKKLTKYASNEITFEEFADIPKEKAAKFKEKCELTGISQRQVVINAIDDFLGDD